MNDPEINKVENKLLCGKIAKAMKIPIIGDCEDGFCRDNHDNCCLKDVCKKHPVNRSWKDIQKETLSACWIGLDELNEHIKRKDSDED